MTGQEAVDWIKDNVFPKWELPTGEQLREWCRRLDGWDEQALKTASRQHYFDRGSFSSPVLKDLIDLCVKLKPKPVVQTSGPPVKVRVIDFIRRESDCKHLVFGLEDARAIECHFVRCWAAVKAKCTGETEINSGRRLIFAHCKMALLELRWEEADAIDFARQVVDLKAGETIPKPTKLFRDMPKPDAKNSFEALADLAVAEHVKNDEALAAEFAASEGKT